MVVLDEAASRLLEEGQAHWPLLRVTEQQFAGFLAGKTLPRDAAARAHAADLVLACACSLGDAEAVACFERDHFGEVAAVAVAMRFDPARSDELRQAVRTALFAPPAKIATFAGAGGLRGWTRVVASRVALKLLRSDKRGHVGDAELLAHPDGGDDPELGYFKRLYRSEFREAFEDAVQALSPRERNLLKYATADGLDSDGIAAIYRVHRTTVNRWLASARASLATRVRAALAARLRVSPSELDSILRLIESRIEITLSGFATKAGAE